VNAIAVDPRNPNVVFVGPAQGGVFRSMDGGQTWIELLGRARSLAVGSIAIDPLDHDKVVVGTGEGNFSLDSHFGAGIYVIEEATSWHPRLKGPYNLGPDGSNVLAYRAITSVIVSPTNDNIVFVATSSAFGGLGGAIGPTPPVRGLYRSTNFLSGKPIFTRLTTGPGADTRVTSAVLDPTNPSRLVLSIEGVVSGSATDMNPTGGIYRTTNALDPNPLFTRAPITGTSDSNLPLGTNVKLATVFDPAKSEIVILAATDETANTTQIDPSTGLPIPYIDQGMVRKSVDGGTSFPLTLPDANGFAGGQGFYNVAIAIDQTNAHNVYLAGTLSSAGVDPDGGRKPIHDDGSGVTGSSSTGPKLGSTDPVNGTGPHNSGGTFQYSNDGGATFVPSVQGLHADSHAIAVAPSNPRVIYTGNDGGVWKSTDGGKTWIDINTFGFVATQFESVAVHPTDPNFTIGGTQDNGTELRAADGAITRADFGDGGYSLIDQSATDTENVTLYHTYFNATGSLIGFGRVTKSSCATDGEWSFMGIYTGTVDPTVHCDGTTDSFNGISINDNVNFYAPMALGPGTPNTVYFGTDRLYRSSDRGTTMHLVSQAPILPLAPGFGATISSIAISKQNDNVRLIGLEFGNVFATAKGSSALVDVTGPIPAKYVTRVEIDPTNSNIAYVALNGYGLPEGQQIWKTTNLVDAVNAGQTPNWTAASIGIPDVSVNSIAIDPSCPRDLYAGTDYGVYISDNGGRSWKHYGIGLPKVEVYDLAIQSKYHILRVATHGLGWWEAPTRSGLWFFGNELGQR
jgi:photosystem II stability/assembly factor-like uncharacterized protein